MKKLVCTLLTLVMILCLLPTVVFADGEVTYTLYAGKNYRITNSDVDKGYSVKNDAKSNKTYDTVRYNTSGKVENCGQNQTGTFYVNEGGETIITVNSEPIVATLDAAQSSCLTFEEITNPALVTYSLSAGKNYKLTNSDVDNGHSISNNAGNARTFDEARYNASGKEIGAYQSITSYFYVEKGGESIISVNERDITGYMPYTYKNILSFTEINEPALATFSLEMGKNYKLINNDVDNGHSISNNAGNARTFDEARYNASGKEIGAYQSITSYFYVEKGGESIISVNERDITGYIPYSRKDTLMFFEIGDPALIKFTLSAGNKYTFINKDVDNGHSISNNAGNARTFDEARYNANGKESGKYQNKSSYFYVEKGGETIVTINERDIETYMPYTTYERTITITDGNGNTIAKPSYPSIYEKVPYQARLTDGSGSVALTGNTTSTSGAVEYIYDVNDPGAEVTLPVDALDSVTDPATAADAVNILTTSMTAGQKESAAGTDLATLYAETAVSKAANKAINSNAIVIDAAAVADLQTVAAQTSAAVEAALTGGGVTVARQIADTVTLTTDTAGELTIQIDPDILTTQVDKVRVETPTYALTFKVADLEEDLTGVLTFTAEDIGTGYVPGQNNSKTTVKVTMPNGKTSNPVTLSLPADSGSTTYQAVVTTEGTATSSKYNPATTTMDGKVTTSGNYTVQTNEKDFTDISNKSAEMQAAIRYLASKGIITGTTDTTFSPDASISRAEIAALLVRALGKLDSGATASFNDVTRSNWFYSAAASSQKHGLINGYSDNTFRGTTAINKEQIVVVAGRVLTSEMGYKSPTNVSSYLSRYSDSVVDWAQPEVALATRENLVVYRTDGTFSGAGNMTRGDAAIIIYRLFQRIW